jgi:protein phosphatase 1 regulatory subunit 42
MVRISLDVITRATMQRRRREEEDKNFLKRLTHVNLSDKKVEVIEGLEGCVNLQCLYLTDNKITRIESLHFAQNLTHLYLQDNRIEVMENLDPLSNLQKLFIGGNNIQEVRGLESCTQLQELHVQAQRLAGEQALLFDHNTLIAISGTLRVLNAQKNNISQPSQFAMLRELERLDLSLNRVASFDELGALFGDEACMNMSSLDLRDNPVSKQHKLRDFVALMSPNLGMLDGREITQVERRFLVNKETAKSRARNRQQLSMLQPLNAPQPGGHSFGPPQGIEGQLLLESQGDFDPVEARRRMRPHVDTIPHKGSGLPAEREVYSGGLAAPDRDAQKAALQAHMQFEGDVPVVRKREEQAELRGDAQGEFNRVAREIEERQEFLETMNAAGRGHEYDAMIKAQIAEKVRELLMPSRACY